MPHPCVVCGRSRMNPNNREEEYMFFGFPVNYDDRCKKWLEFCGREDLYKLTKKQLLQRMVCSKHFEEKDFLNEYFDRLNCTAVPTIYDPKQSLYNITCVLCRRFRKDPPGPDYDGTTFHHFPGEEFRCLKWLDFVGVDSYYRLTRKEILFCFICSHHFDKSQFMAGYWNRLVDNAVPNIRYPDQMDGSEQFIMEIMPDIKNLHGEKSKKLDPLPPEVLDSQACAACGRSRSDPRNKTEKYKFHPFPAYEIGRCLRWCQFLGREDLLKMSPNQIRKLVLCSKHFLSGQSFQKLGSCDAVPTIKDVVEGKSKLIVPEIPMEIRKAAKPPEKDVEKVDQEISTGKRRKRKNSNVPFVSSKKPFVEDKPCPLAKKRGKSKRPTTIKLPKPVAQKSLLCDINNRVLRKLPLPPASRNCDIWKVQIPNQITIANNISSIANINATDMKKVIVPFTGDISSLGKPIPVSSLSSIPPGLLIKINLPEITKQSTVNVKKPRKQKQMKLEDPTQLKSQAESHTKRKQGHSMTNLSPKVNQDVEMQLEVDDTSNQYVAELLTFPGNNIVIERPPDAVAHEEVVIEKIVEDDHFEESFEEVIQEINVTPEASEEHVHEKIDIKNDLPYMQASVGEEQCRVMENKATKPRKMMRVRARRTLIPIRSELSRFLNILKPHVRRLPKKARAQVKLAIVNMVINHL